MPYEQLIESVEVSAEERIMELREKAHRQGMEIRKEAEGKDETIKRKHLDAAKRAVVVERNKSIAKVKEETRMQLIHAKDEVFQKACSEAKKILSSARENANYEKIFSKMLQEAVLELEGQEIQLHIDKRDESLCKKLLPELNLNCEIITDLISAGGLNVGTKDQKFIVFNTIESRYEKAKELMRLDLFAALYGGQGGV
jgi:V/A-type H+/Na+-transporting ATPase subunit E